MLPRAFPLRHLPPPPLSPSDVKSRPRSLDCAFVLPGEREAHNTLAVSFFVGELRGAEKGGRGFSRAVVIERVSARQEPQRQPGSIQRQIHPKPRMPRL